MKHTNDTFSNMKFEDMTQPIQLMTVFDNNVYDFALILRLIKLKLLKLLKIC